MSRCIDDHEDAICLCESEINRTLFPSYALALHTRRMFAHGFSFQQIIELLDERTPDDVDSLMSWYEQILPLAENLYGKRRVRALGDKSPDFYKQPLLVEEMVANHPLVYTVRDPRAILRSIWRQTDASDQVKLERGEDLLGNIRAWRPHWDRPNLLTSRFEDLIEAPYRTMSRVYAHLGLEASYRFMESFPRQHPSRFLWETTVDLTSGEPRSFDLSRCSIDDKDLLHEQVRQFDDDPDIEAYRLRFQYRV